MTNKKSINGRGYLLAFLATVLAATILLILSSLLPQSCILENIAQSIGYLHSEGERPSVFDREESASLDTFSDIQMLRAAGAMHDGNLGAILTNDLYCYESADSITQELEFFAAGMQEDSIMHYVRYWMGFRALLRVGLTFLSYFQIRRYLGLAFFCLLFALTFRIAKYTDEKLAYLFALSVILVRPQVIVSSLQFCCCFFIAFIAMLIVPWLHRNPKWEGIFFMEIGMLTMYLDFYSVPLITFGYPMVYLLVLQVKNSQTVSVKRICTLLLYWFLGWGLMWMAKLLLTTLFTEINGFENGISSFLGRVGIIKNQDLLQYYSIPYAFSQLFKVIFSDFEGAIIYCLGILFCVAAIVYRTVKRSIPLGAYFAHKYFLIIAAIPFVWFVITAQPIAIHAFFQYRSIAIVYWSLFAYLYVVFNAKEADGVVICRRQ